MSRDKLLHLRSAYMSQIRHYMSIGQDSTKLSQSLHRVNEQLKDNGGIPRHYKHRPEDKYKKDIEAALALRLHYYNLVDGLYYRTGDGYGEPPMTYKENKAAVVESILELKSRTK